MNVGGTARYVGGLVENNPVAALATGYVRGSEVEDSCVSSLPLIRIPHLSRNISIINDIRAWKELRKVIKKLNPEIIHTHTFKAGLIGRAIRGRHKHIHTYHGHLFGDNTFSPLSKKLIAFVEKGLAKKTDLLISVGVNVGIEMQDRGVGKTANWLSIPPGIAPLILLDKKSARKSLGLPESGLLVGWMARMTDVKNPDLFLEIASRLPSINFVMAGGGDLFKEVKKAAPKNVDVIGWSDSATFWSAVDCAVSTSINEGMPVALIEAQQAGIPVVATNVGSVSEVVVHEITGLISQNNPDEFVKALCQITGNQHSFQKMSFDAKQYSLLKFSLKNMLEAHKVAYDQVLDPDSLRL